MYYMRGVYTGMYVAAQPTMREALTSYRKGAMSFTKKGDAVAWLEEKAIRGTAFALEYVRAKRKKATKRRSKK